MSAMDALQGSMAECYVILDDGRRYNMASMLDFHFKMEITSKELAILGQTGKGNRSTGWKGTFSGKMYYNTSVYRRMMLQYKSTGVLPAWDCQISNEDGTSAAGRQTAIFRGCQIKGGTLAAFNAEDDILTEDLEGTFEDFDFPELFKELPGMIGG